MTGAITIRHAMESDRAKLRKLAELDDRRAPEGDALLAFEDGELRAALPLSTGPALADPFHLTNDVLALLRMRAAQQA